MGFRSNSGEGQGWGAIEVLCSCLSVWPALPLEWHSTGFFFYLLSGGWRTECTGAAPGWGFPLAMTCPARATRLAISLRWLQIERIAQTEPIEIVLPGGRQGIGQLKVLQVTLATCLWHLLWFPTLLTKANW
jgi:hypothetical protein